MQVQMRPIAAVRPYPNNPRHNDDAVDAVAASIREFGFRQPVVVDEEDVIVVGHTRYKAALKLGLTEIPVHVAVGLSPAQAKAYRLADNQTARLSQWDDDKLPIELAQLQEMDFDLSLTGFSEDELLRLLAPEVTDGLTDPDDVPEPPDEPVTKPGDLWVLGQHRLLCGDAGKAEDVDRLLDGHVVHLVNTDPPYNVKVEPRSNNAIAAGLSSFDGTTHHQKLDVARHPSKAKATDKKLRPKDRPLANDFVSDDEFARLLRAWFGNVARVLEPGRAFYLWGGYSNIANYPSALSDSELYFSQAIIWVKGHPVLTRKDFLGDHEWCYYGWRLGAAHQFLGPNNVRDVWEVKKVSPQKMSHLCLHPDAAVLTDAGYRPVRSVAPGDRVYAGDGCFHRVSHVSSHPYASAHLYRIRARGGNQTTDASDNHPFLIWRPRRRGAAVAGGDVAWVRADEVRRGDYTMTPVPAEPDADPFPDRDEGYWFLLGLYLAQGTLQNAGHGANRYPSFHLHKRRRDLAALIHDRWASVSEYDPNEYGEEASQGLTVMAFDPQAGAEFERLGGRLSHAKRLDPAVLRLPRGKRLAVFRGWLEGDGCRVRGRAYYQGNTVSADLAAQLAVLAESVGYRTNVYAYDPPADYGGIGGRPFKTRRRTYYLYFYERGQLPNKRGSATWLEHDGRGYSLRYVRSVERVAYSGDVWNLTVEGHPSFQTAVGLSHNTEKPVELAERAMLYSSRPGENVLDLFGGSGSTLIAAERTGRRAFLTELDPLYCDVIVQRFESHAGKKAERLKT